VLEKKLNMTKIRAAITGVGGYVPDYILTNQEIETMVARSEE
jgi:3-oxoacyl-[acyl-carrier-protein] synthase-3